jgi:hypothetical protein
MWSQMRLVARSICYLAANPSETTLCPEMEQLNLSMFQPASLANLHLESTLVNQIVEAQKTDAGIAHIKEHMAVDHTTCFRHDDKGVLWFKN